MGACPARRGRAATGLPRRCPGMERVPKPKPPTRVAVRPTFRVPNGERSGPCPWRCNRPSLHRTFPSARSIARTPAMPALPSHHGWMFITKINSMKVFLARTMGASEKPRLRSGFGRTGPDHEGHPGRQILRDPRRQRPRSPCQTASAWKSSKPKRSFRRSRILRRP